MKTRISSLAALSAFLIAGCTSYPEIDPGAERAALTETVESYYDGLNALRSDVAAFYSDSAVVLRPGLTDITGRAALDQFVVGIIQTPGFEVGFETLLIELSDDATFGYSMAIVTVGFDGEDGERIVEQNRDLHLWRKSDDGSWELVLDIWNEASAED